MNCLSRSKIFLLLNLFWGEKIPEHQDIINYVLSSVLKRLESRIKWLSNSDHVYGIRVVGLEDSRVSCNFGTLL